ncbi:MAG: PSD1 and planctomycete cytochrome C domain-containing protein [Planctomycetaceae bacterium]
MKHCYPCHSTDADVLKGNLRLDDAAASRKGGDSGAAVVPGRPDDSLLLSAITYESFEMPPDQPLPERVVADFRKWIAEGAHDPRQSTHTPADHPEEIDIEAGRTFWAFQPPMLSAFLQQDDTAERHNSDRIDALIEHRLREADVPPNEVADRQTLLRRLAFDLTGLPPTPEQMLAFVKSQSPTIVEDTVDELLDSPTYGQRWARLWLDVARYAEDQAHIVGNNKELFYPNAWMYRDWVIAALNDDMPYDRFVRLQLAADLIEPENAAVQPALGFIGLGPKYYRRNDPEVMAEEWEDRIDVVSRGLQGLTVACARCHDHKYDPIPTEDYYALAGVFASTEMYNKPLTSPNADERNVGNNKDDKDNKKDKKNKTEDALHVIRDNKPHDLAVMIRGSVDNTGDVVPRGYLQVLFEGPRRTFTEGSGRRELAAAITDPLNPLTARVIVNRIWSAYFGRGLVATPSNFGQLGDRPTHPELLDDLAVRFMQNGWNLKWLHRQIVLSKTYQRSSELSTAAVSKDPANMLLWRMPRRRLPVEAWRDAVLSVAGKLDTETGGRSIQPDDVAETRRTVYSEVSRFELNPLLARFDFPDPNVHAARRVETNTPLQKLFLLNSPFMTTYGQQLAERVSDSDGDIHEQVRRLFELTFQRAADDDEQKAAVLFLNGNTDKLPQLAQALLASNEFWYLD